MGRCKFNSKWLDKKDCSGHRISLWAEKRGDDEMFCKVCDCSISIVKGFYHIKQHFETEKHQTNFNIKMNENQLHIANTLNPIKLYCTKDAAHTAEVIWCMKIVASDVSASFSQDIGFVFKAMFTSDGAVPEKFSLNPTKIRYLMNEALSPYFRSKLLKDIGSSYFTLLFDETTNNAGAKELQTSIRFWSEERNEVVSHHLETFHMGHATAENVKENILLALSNANLQLSKLLMLGSDGPKVNQKVFSLVNEEVKAVRGTGLVDIGFCNIHMIHNAFQKGLEELGSDASELIIYIYRYFKDWPSRREDFITCQNNNGLANVMFIKHVSSRWLTINPAAKRLLEQWDAVIEYFLKFVPLHQKTLMNTNSYKRITGLLKKKTIKAELHFVCVSSALFTKFTALYQRQEPLIHMLHDHVKDLVVSLMGRLCKPDVIKQFRKSPSEEVFKNDCLLSLKEMSLSEDLNILTAHLSESEKDAFVSQVRKHYAAAGKYILAKKVMFSRILKSFSCIRPDQINLKANEKKFQILANSLNIPYEEEKLIDEWKLLPFENAKHNNRIDHFWSQFFTVKNVDGSLKYQNISIIVKAALTLSHGNAEVERGFSRSCKILTQDRASMSVRTLNSRLNIADGLKRYDNKPYLVPITDELLNAARNAYKSYENYLLKQKERAEEEQRKKLQEEKALAVEEEKKKLLLQNKEEIEGLKMKLEDVRESEKVQNSAVNQLLEEANQKLKEAIQKNNVSGIQVAQAILEGAMKSNIQCGEKRKQINNIEKEISKKKDSLITTFFHKKPRKN